MNPPNDNPNSQNIAKLVYVGFWKRVLATLIDTLLLLAIILPSLFLIYGESYWNYLGGTSESFFAGPADFIFNWVIPAVIVIALWRRFSATPGKMAVRAKIVDSRTGLPPSLGQCIGRYLAYFPSILIFGLGILWVAFDSRKQGWHDKLAGTVVIGPREDVENVRFDVLKDGTPTRKDSDSQAN